MLTGAQIDAFLADGFVAVRGAVRADIAAQCRDQIWSELAARGVRRDDASTWTEPVVRIDCPEGGPFATAGTAPRLWQCYDQLPGMCPCATRSWCTRRPGRTAAAARG
jgi:hypothetical protein